ncbi:GDP-mannose 4,6 dehydratase [Lysobacteraceae bacterium NML93-0792]|nr:GDP-mannose 4,6 dehydratase [Xanthomonadaceae bacterium NML93-0792]PBS15282.1 GDP-mannose 4,6 dehydratase [Xanthomonadaceae bacterium NML93-0793]PBS18146.1 GDP-mannose 4,6 dehydratase [Xanthomonadaceae bacterium NML93-0831]
MSIDRVLLTGAGGFTGGFMRRELEAHGCEVVALGGRGGGSPDRSGDDLAVDLRDADAVRRAVLDTRPGFVVHLAAKAFVGHGSARDFYEVNLLGTRNLLDALGALETPPSRVLLASSANVYGNASEGVLDETATAQPANDYAVSKLAMEYVARLWTGRLPLIITRPFNYTGVGQTANFLIPKIVSHFRDRAPTIELGNLDVWRDISDVRVVVEAYRRLLFSRDAVDVTVNVCSGVTHSLREIVALCEAYTGHMIRVEVNPAFVRQNEVRVLSGDASRLESLVGPLEMPTLADTIAWMMDADA